MDEVFLEYLVALGTADESQGLYVGDWYTIEAVLENDMLVQVFLRREWTCITAAFVIGRGMRCHCRVWYAANSRSRLDSGRGYRSWLRWWAPLGCTLKAALCLAA